MVSGKGDYMLDRIVQGPGKSWTQTGMQSASFFEQIQVMCYFNGRITGERFRLVQSWSLDSLVWD